MAKLIWDQAGARLYETGVSNGVLYVMDATGTYPLGVPWNGLISLSESPEGAESNPIYADNLKYLDLISPEEFKATLEAYTYPKEFEACDGSADLAPGVSLGQQGRKSFGLCYKTNIGNDIDDDLGYKLHIIYGCKASPSEKQYQSSSDSPEAIAFSWEISSTPVTVEGFKPTSTIVIDSRTVTAPKLALIEAELFGDASNPANLPSPADLLALLA